MIFQNSTLAPRQERRPKPAPLGRPAARGPGPPGLRSLPRVVSFLVQRRPSRACARSLGGDVRSPERLADTRKGFVAHHKIERLFKVAKKRSRRDYALLLVAYRHGLRASEVGLLKRTDIDPGTHRIRLSRLKSSHGGEHRLQPEEAQAIRSYLRSRKDLLPHLFLSRNRRPIGRHALNLLLKRYAALANLPEDRRHFDVLKHSIAVHMISGGADAIDVQDWLGHENIQNTMVYVRLASPKPDKKMERLPRSGEIA